jgi:hypothetical protein
MFEKKILGYCLQFPSYYPTKIQPHATFRTLASNRTLRALICIKYLLHET